MGSPRASAGSSACTPASAYHGSPRAIPLLRGKVADVMRLAAFPPDSHDAKALLEIIESYPRDSLFQMTSQDLFTIATGILRLGERQRVRLFVRPDQLARFVECLVCIPRDRFNTENRERVGQDPARRVRRQPSRLDPPAVRVVAGSRPLHRAHAARRAAGHRRARDRGATRARHPGVVRRPAWGADRGARRGGGPASVPALRRRVPSRLPFRLGRALRGRRHRTDRGA